ncbi:tetratricopeptide repeat protein [Prochlorococcus sp. AH-716-P08]|nr:tetratricopeptide repeat protein [Prochlorococcus sp. AH-716-P08]
MAGFGDNKTSKKKLKKNLIDDNLKEQIIYKAFESHSDGNIAEAAKYYQSFINQGFADIKVFSNYGVILQGLGRLKEAELSIRKALELNPNYAFAHLNLGGILKDLGNLKEAELSVRKAIELNPNSPDAYSNLGGILKDLGNLKEAELSVRKAIELDPEYANAHYNLGNILRDFKKLSEAAISLKKAIKLKPNFSEAHRDLGICLYLLKDIDSAVKCIVKAIYFDKKNRTNKLLLSIFQKEQTVNDKDSERNSSASSFTKSDSNSNLITLNLPVDKKLIKCLYKIKARNQEIYQFPTFGDALGSDYKLFERSESSIDSFKKQLIVIVKNSLKSDIFISDSFFTIFRSGGGLVSHDHLNKIDRIEGLDIAKKKFSLVYYLSVGDQTCDEPGILKLENPNQEILPSNGLIIIFPAERKHSVFYKGEKDRIIIGVNFYII